MRVRGVCPRWARSFGEDRCPSALTSASQKELACTKEAYPEEVGGLCPEWCLPSVVVVGAGIAGLSAAHRLFAVGFRDVTLLEASDK